MKKAWLRKYAYILVLLSILTCSCMHAYSTLHACISGSDFALCFRELEVFSIQGDAGTIDFLVDEGLFNASLCSTLVYRDSGQLSLYAENNSMLEVSCPDADMDLVISGADYSNPENSLWLVNVTSGNTVSFRWHWRLVSWLDLYFMFGVGMSGLFLMVFAPSWVAYGFRKNAFDPNKIERVGYAILLFCIGFGLFLSWLLG